MPGGKKAKPYVSDAQRRALNAKARAGEISQAEVDRKNRASKGKRLPDHVKPKR